MSRINEYDMMSNNLLLRNLLAEWPRERLAQIYSGGSNNDNGFCGNYYVISARDRVFGDLFFRLKKNYSDISRTTSVQENEISTASDRGSGARLKGIAGRIFMKSGLYELFFRIRPSNTLINWAREFAPDVILAQGYSLSFVWLVLFLEKHLNRPIAYYSSDDWPSYLHRAHDGILAFTAPFMGRIVERSASRLFEKVDVSFSFNRMMGEEYERRYGKTSTPLMHCDDPDRFDLAEPIRLQPPGVRSIVAAGGFDDSRWSLLLDLEEACCRLNQEGIPVRATILVTSISKQGFENVKSCRYVSLSEDPGHEKLPSYLKGADLLYLPETFNEELALAYRYSISTKAHLFMFSKRPILVYGHPRTGLVTYARREQWARVVDTRSVDLLYVALRQLLLDDGIRETLISRAIEVAMNNHSRATVRKLFRSQVSSIAWEPG
jgi:glycosyltransferase involved in cell wall biosynthesis